MRKNDTRLFSGVDVALALVLLTRLPVPKLAHAAFERQARAVWAFPIAGAVVAVIAGLAGWLGLGAGLPASIAAGLVLSSQILLTGAMHEDGLADTVDGFWGGFTRERRLEIMKDSHIGTFGVLALILSVGLRWATLAALISSAGFAAGFFAVIVVAAMSRAAMPVLMHTLPNARQSGLSSTVGQPAALPVAIGGVVAAGFGIVLIGLGPTAVLLATGAGVLLGLALLACSKIAGQTGDVLGATQQVLEIWLLLTCLVLTPIG